MTSLNVRLGGHTDPITIRISSELHAKLDQHKVYKRSVLIRTILSEYVRDTPGTTLYEKLKLVAQQEGRSLNGLIRHVLQQSMSKPQGV